VFEGPGLAVSFPATELKQVVLPGSLFKAEALTDAPISGELRAALGLVEDVCTSQGIPLVCIARPEIFTNSLTMAWLKEKLGGIRDHLCISDGATVRVIPDMQNHMFLYRLGLQQNQEAFNHLVRRAPELLSTIHSQVNTAFQFRLRCQTFAPPTVLLLPDSAPPEEPANFFRFFLNRSSIKTAVEWIIANGSIPNKEMGVFTKVLYVPLTEAALNNKGFLKILATAVAETYFEPTSCLIMRVPTLGSLTAELADQINTVLEGLAKAPLSIPRVPAQNVFLCTTHIDDKFVAQGANRVELVLHETFDFWRHSSDFYSGFQDVSVLACQDRYDTPTLLTMLSEILGREPEVHWLKSELLDDYE
jgi:hypothetical protein